MVGVEGEWIARPGKACVSMSPTGLATCGQTRTKTCAPQEPRRVHPRLRPGGETDPEGPSWRFDSASSQVAGCMCTAVVGVLVAFGRQHDRAKALALRGAEWPIDVRGCKGQLSIPRLAQHEDCPPGGGFARPRL